MHLEDFASAKGVRPAEKKRDHEAEPSTSEGSAGELHDQKSQGSYGSQNTGIPHLPHPLAS